MLSRNISGIFNLQLLDLWGFPLSSIFSIWEDCRYLLPSYRNHLENNQIQLHLPWPEYYDGGHITQEAQKTDSWYSQTLAVELDLLDHLNSNNGVTAWILCLTVRPLSADISHKFIFEWNWTFHLRMATLAISYSLAISQSLRFWYRLTKINQFKSSKVH